MIVSLYDTLGCSADASDDDVRKAYRRACQRAHPDKHGGDGRQQQEINDAFAVLSDPERRAEYDRTGNTGPKRDHDEMARNTILQEFARMVESDNIIDPIYAVRVAIARQIAEVTGQQADVRRRIPRMERKQRQVKGPAEGNFLAAFIAKRLDDMARSVRMFDESLEVLRIADRMMEGYTFAQDARPGTVFRGFVLGPQGFYPVE